MKLAGCCDLIARWEKHLVWVIVAWVCLITFPLLQLKRPTDFYIEEYDALKFAPIAILLLLFHNVIYYGRIRSVLLSGLNDLGFSALSIVSLTILAISMSTGRLAACANAVVLIIALLNFRLMWTMSRQALGDLSYQISVCLAVFICTAFIVHGKPDERWVGGIHPNIFAASALSICFFSLVGRFRMRIAFFAVGVVTAYAVSSRYAMLGQATMALFFIVRQSAAHPRKYVLATVVGLAAVIVAAAWRFDVILDIFAANTVDRGIGSGLTGRLDLQENFWTELLNEGLVGYGFRQREEYAGTHNGYLNVLLENGIIAGLGVIVYSISKAIALAYSAFKHLGSVLDASVAAGFLGFCVGAYFQPQFINFGDPMGLGILMCLVYPLKLKQARMRPASPLTATAL